MATSPALIQTAQSEFLLGEAPGFECTVALKPETTTPGTSFASEASLLPLIDQEEDEDSEKGPVRQPSATLWAPPGLDRPSSLDEETEIVSNVSHVDSDLPPFPSELRMRVRNTFVDVVAPKASLRRSKSLGELEVASLLLAQAPYRRWRSCSDAPTSAAVEDSPEVHSRAQPCRAPAPKPCQGWPQRQKPQTRLGGGPRQEASRTTLRFSHLPRSWDCARLLDFLATEGALRASFPESMMHAIDFLYVPMDFKSKRGCKIAYVNFTSPELAEQAHEQLQGIELKEGRFMEVRWSDEQGLANHVERYRNSPVMHESVGANWRPALFHQGERILFPPPTKTLKKPFRD